MSNKSLVRALLFSIYILALLCSQSIAQDYEEDETEPAALTISILPDGKTNIGYTHFQPIADLDPVRTALASATGCPASAFTQPPPYHVNTARISDPKIRERVEAANLRESQSMLTGDCSSFVQSVGLRRNAKIDTAPLQMILADSGQETLWVTISHPDQGSSEHSGTYATVETARSPYASFRVPVSGTPAVLSVNWGYTHRDIYKYAGLLGGFIFLPIAICYWVRRKALTIGALDPTAAWFSYFRTVNLCTNAVFLFWMIAGGNSRQGMVGLIETMAGSHKNVGIIATLALTILPPWIIYFVCLAGSYRVLVQIRGIEWKFRNFLLVQFLTVSAILVPVATIVSGMQVWRTSLRAAVVVFVVGWVLTIICVRLKIKFTKTQPEPITTGELRDRIFHLAERAGVKLKHLFVMPAGKMQVANAYAAANQVVTFTDYVLHRLNKREVDAIAGHELSHLRHNHPTKLVMALLGAIFLPAVVPTIFTMLLSFSAGIFMAVSHNYALYGRVLNLMAGMWSSPFADPIILAFGLLGFYFFSRKFEKTADEGAVHLTNDPEALIAGLLKLNRLNLMPFQWNKGTGLLLTHPSTLKRIERIAALGNVSQDRVQQLLAEFSNHNAVPDPSDYYLIPDLSKERVVTTAEQVQKSQTNLFLLLAAHVLPPTVFVWIAQRTAFGSSYRWTVLFVGAVVSLFTYYLFSRTLALRGRAQLRTKFEQKFRREGLLLDYSKARVIGFAPGPHPRFYVTSWNWDNGLLILRRGSLIFLGDQVRFRIPVEHISRIWLGQGAPSFAPVKRIYLQTIDPETGHSDFFNLANLEPCTPLGLTHQQKDLFTAIQYWRDHQSEFPNPPDDLLKLAPPSFGQVTCLTPDRISDLRKEFSFALVFGLLAWLAISAAKIHGFTYVMTVVALLRAYEFLPYRFYRDRSPDGTPIRKTSTRAERVPVQLPTA